MEGRLFGLEFLDRGRQGLELGRFAEGQPPWSGRFGPARFGSALDARGVGVGRGALLEPVGVAAGVLADSPAAFEYQGRRDGVVEKRPIVTIVWISLVPVLLLGGCASTKESLLPQDGPSMQAIYDAHFEAMAIDDPRNFVKKAVNWALRGIGKRNLALNKAAAAFSEKLLALDDKTARWVARDALRELQSDKIQARLHQKQRKSSS